MAIELTVSNPDTALATMRRHFGAGAFGPAAEVGWRLLREDPRDPVLLNLLGLAEHRLGNHKAGIVLLERAVKANPEGVAPWNDLGNIYCAVRDYTAAEHAYRQAIRYAPDCAEIYNNLGVLAGEREHYEEARVFYERALALKPKYAEALCNLGIALGMMGRFQKAARRYEQALVLRPEYHKARFNLAMTNLLLGDLAAGWRDWDARWQHEQLAPSLRHFKQPAWKGESLVGKTILLYAEQGMGDTLQFVRYLPLVLARGAKVVLEVQPELVRLFKLALLTENVADAEVRIVPRAEVSKDAALPAFDMHCALMSLPVVFHTALATIPRKSGYLLVPKAARQGEDLRVGIVWAGSATHKRDAQRSLPLAALSPLFGVAGVRWFSLQKGPAADRLASLPASPMVEDLSARLNDYADTAEAIAGLDLVITVDTSVAHLAGAMGKSVWILLHYHPDWRWLLRRKDSPWYASARLYRQPSPGDWASTVAGMAHDLANLSKTLSCPK